MKSKAKIGLAGLLLAGLTSCSSITPHASIDIAYIPLRNNEKLYQNELRTELEQSLDFNFKNGMTVTLGAREITYSNFVNPSFSGLFNPTFQDYVAFGILSIPTNIGLVQFYASHNCFHPVGKDYILNNYDERQQVVSQGETKIGVKIEIK